MKAKEKKWMFLFFDALIRVVSFILFFMVFSSVAAQRVPSEMTLDNLKLTITESARKEIQKDVNRLTKSEKHFNILVDRMNLYFPYIEREHIKIGTPDVIKFLAIQESALISDAVSSSNAVGFWQFKDFTAREMELKVNRNVDERLNIVASSRGSGKYFKSNNFFFNNWAYAIIAYQAGTTGAKKHTDESKYKTKKITITTKTYWYLKKFIAHWVAFSPFVGKPHSEKIWLDELTNVGGKSLEQIARQEKVDLKELKDYNKWLKKGFVPKDKTYSVMIPRQGRPPKWLIATNSRKSSTTTPKSHPIYPTEIKKGITDINQATVIYINGIPSILARLSDDIQILVTNTKINEKKFRKYNDLKNSDEIISNKFYYIKKKKNKAMVGFHVAKENETLWDISQQYGIKLSKLRKKNRMSIIDKLKQGRVLWLKKNRPANEPIRYHNINEKVLIHPKIELESDSNALVTPFVKNVAEEEKITIPSIKKVIIHTVAKGESLWNIAQYYDVKLEDLLRWNELPNPDALHVGQNIQVKAPIEEASMGKNIISHIVQSQETMYRISIKYEMTVDEIMDLNKLNSFNLSVGQELKVYEKK